MMKKILLAALLALNSFAQISFFPPVAGGGVGGASSLLTPGAVPVVISPGVLGQDANFNYAANTLNVPSISGIAGFGLTFIGPSNQAVNFVTQGASSYINFNVNGSNVARFSPSTGNLIVGGTTDGNYKFDVRSSGSTGTLRVFDQTATTGTTKVDIRGGAADTIATSVFSITRNSDGVKKAYFGVDNNGARLTFDNLSSAPGSRLEHDFLTLSLGAAIAWTQGDANNTKDSGLKRADPGYVAVTNGSSGLGKIVVSQATPSASTDAGTAGAIWADATYIYVQTGASTVKRIPLVTF